jgi:universal stress protein A
MFRNILVPTDLSEKTHHSLEIAVKLAIQHKGKVTLLHVIETIEDANFDEFEDFYNKLKRRAQRIMNEMTAPYMSGETIVEKEVMYGRRVQEIVQFADGRAIDLIVLSSHKIDVQNPSQGWSTISYKVGFLSPCPVMLIK